MIVWHLFCAKIALEWETLCLFAIYEVAFSTADDRGDRPRCTNGAFSTERHRLLAQCGASIGPSDNEYHERFH